MADKADAPEPILGIDPAAAASAATLSVDLDEFVEGAYTEFHGTVIGLGGDEGGVVKEGNNGPFTTKPQLIVQYRVDASENESDLDSPFTRSFIGIPKITTRDGVARRARPQRNSAYDLWLRSLESVGITNKPDLATFLLMKSIDDLIGLQASFQVATFENPVDPNGRPMRVRIPIEVFGYDNEIRVAANLPPMEQGSNGVWQRGAPVKTK